MRHRFHDLKKGTVCTGFAKVLIGIVCLSILWGSVYAGEDPYQYLPDHFEVYEWVTDPMTGGYGRIRGANSFFNGDVLGLAYQSGKAVFFYEGNWSSIAIFDIPENTMGITEVPPDKYEGSVVVCAGSTIYFYDWSGTLLDAWSTPYELLDITYDITKDRLIISTEHNGARVYNPDGADPTMAGAAMRGIQYIDLSIDNLGRDIDDMHQSDEAFFRIYSNGTSATGKQTDFGQTYTEGIAYTQNHAYAAMYFGTYGDYIAVYDKLPFQDYMNYSAPIKKPVKLTPFKLTYAEGTVDSGNYVDPDQINSLVREIGQSSLASLDVTDRPVNPAELEPIQHAYAGQVSFTGKADLDSDHYWEGFRELHEGKREAQLFTALEGSFRLCSYYAEDHNVELSLSIEGCATGDGTRLVGDAGSTLRRLAELLCEESHVCDAIYTAMRIVLADQLSKYEIPADPNTESLDDLITKYENYLNEHVHSEFKAQYGGSLSIGSDEIINGDNPPDQKILEATGGYSTWQTRWVSNNISEGPASDSATVPIFTNREIPFRIDLATKAATWGYGANALAAIRRVTLTVTDKTTNDSIAQQTWNFMPEDYTSAYNEIFPDYYKRSYEKYDPYMSEFNEWLVDGAFTTIDFLSSLKLAVGSIVFRGFNDVVTSVEVEFLRQLAKAGFLEDEAGILGITASPAFCSLEYPLTEDTDNIIIDYGLLCSDADVRSDALRFKVLLQVGENDYDLADINFAGLTWGPIDEADGLRFFAGPSQLRFDVSTMPRKTGILTFLLDTEAESPYKGAFVIDDITSTVMLRSGDFQPDGEVDLEDFTILGSAWSSQTGGENWNEACDINDPKDGVINILDLAILAGNWMDGVYLIDQEGGEK